jgi:magnesium transporter
MNENAEELNRISAVNIGDRIIASSVDDQLNIFQALPFDKRVLVFEYLPFRIQMDLLNALPSENIAQLLNALSPDDRTSLLSELPVDLMNHLLKYLSPQERALSLRLLGYPENSVGRLMTPEYIAVKLDWTVQHVLDEIRTNGRDSETINVVYAVDDEGRLIDDFRIRQLLISSLNTILSDIADHKFIALDVSDDQEKAVQIFHKYERSALPVTNTKGILLGIVTSDDIMDASIAENTEDMQKIGGLEALSEPYLETPFVNLMQKRIGWLLVLFIGEMLTASAMGYFEEEIAKAVVLALFVPLIISSGGNAGSQASTLVIRAMALGEVKMRDWWRVMRREIFSGLFLGTALGLVGFLRIGLWSQFSLMYGEHWLLVAWTIFFALIGVVMWGTLAGSMLPLLLRRCGFDPATSSAPFVATLVDVTGLIIYFSIAIILLRGTLL